MDVQSSTCSASACCTPDDVLLTARIAHRLHQTCRRPLKHAVAQMIQDHRDLIADERLTCGVHMIEHLDDTLASQFRKGSADRLTQEIAGSHEALVRRVGQLVHVRRAA